MGMCSCPACKTELRLPTALVGQTVTCPRCQATFVGSDDTSERDGSGDFEPAVPQRPQVSAPGNEERLSRRPLELERRDEFNFDDQWEQVSIPAQLPGNGLALAAVLGLVAVVFCELVGGVALYLQYVMLERARAGVRPTVEQAERNDAFVNLTALAEIACTLVTAVLFLCWFYRARANVSLWGARGLTGSPGWAVGYFFIPILNLFRPCQVAQETWRASGPETGPHDAFTWRRVAGSPLIVAWWITWLIARILNTASGRLGDQDLDAMIGSTMVGLLGAGLSLLAALLAVLVVLRMRSRQAERFARLSSAAVDPATGGA
jgi:hypothetical protein